MLFQKRFVRIKFSIYVSISNQVPKAQQVKRDKGTRKFIFRLVTVYYIYNIGVLTVNIEFMWLCLETGERQAIPEKLYLGQKEYITKLYPVNVI
jgi:hypothetical protein